MPLDPKAQVGINLAIALAGIYAPGAGQTVSALSALMAAVNQYNSDQGQPPDYVPTYDELTAFIADRESKRIPDVPEA